MSNMWDFLRPLDQFAVSISGPIEIVVFVISVFIFAISLMAYFKAKSRRLLFVSAAFFLFMVKWLLQTVDFFVSPGLFFSVPSQGIVELVIMLLLLIAMVKK